MEGSIDKKNTLQLSQDFCTAICILLDNDNLTMRKTKMITFLA